MEQGSRKIAWTNAVIHGLVHASVLLLPSLMVDLQHAFRVSLLEVLAVSNLMYLVYGLAAIPAGYLADRVGSRRMLIGSAAGCAVALTLVATAQSFAVLGGALVMLGLSAGIYHPSGLSLLSRAWARVSAGGPSASTGWAATSARPWPPSGLACSPRSSAAGAGGSPRRRCCPSPAWPWP
jgi:MFS family permease